MSWVPKVERKRHFCHACKSEIIFEVKMQRADGCPHCAARPALLQELRVLGHSAHNQCREHIAEYIPDRERANHCSFFTFRGGGAGGTRRRISREQGEAGRAVQEEVTRWPSRPRMV